MQLHAENLHPICHKKHKEYEKIKNVILWYGILLRVPVHSTKNDKLEF
jgi:hypothetical protein